MRRRFRGTILLVLAAWMCGLTYAVFYYPEFFVGPPPVAIARTEPEDSTPDKETKSPVQNKKSIVIGAVDIEWGKTIGEILKENEESFKAKPYPTELLPEGYIEFAKLKQYSDQILLADLKKDKPLLQYKLHRNQERLIEERTQEGTRAMAVKVDEVVGVSGYIKPYSRVDVLVTLSRRKPPETRTVLRSVLVLAAGARVERVSASTSENPISLVKSKTGEQEGPSKVNVVTLQVSPEQAEKLALASSEGTLRLALRNPIDKLDHQKQGISRGVNLTTLLSQPSQARRVRVIKGSKVETIFVR